MNAVAGLLDQLDPPGLVVTGDAQFTQREVCQQVVAKGGTCFEVKQDQPTLLQDIWAIWELEPAGDPQAVQIDQHGGRVEQRRLWVSDLLVGYSDWPHLAQVCKMVGVGLSVLAF